MSWMNNIGNTEDKSVQVSFLKDNQLSLSTTEDTLSACWERALDEEIDTDVTFIVGEDKVHIKAHKLVLALRSRVFKAMFGDHFDSNRPVPIKDAEEKEFRKFLRYGYIILFEEFSFSKPLFNY